MKTSDNKERFTAYLLGELPETERARIEEEYFSDESAFEEMLAIEMELHDAYVKNSLSVERQRAFEQRLLSTDEQRWHLKFSDALLRLRQPSRPASRSHRTWLVTAATLSIVVFAGALTFFQWPENPAAPDPFVPRQVTTSFAVASGIIRSVAEEPTLTISPQVDVVRLSAEVDNGQRVRFGVLRTPEGNEVWRSVVTPRAENSGAAVLMEIPAQVFSSGHYVLTLYGASLATQDEIADFAFLVRRD